ncbi:hypothetical protein ACFLRB_05345 [Acidobacteriota bacterium]
MNKKTRKKISLGLCLITVSVVLFTIEVKNTDKPLKGEWNFSLKKVWETQKAGREMLASIAQIQVSDKGTVYVYDRKRMRFNIYDGNGEFLNTFGRLGEGPGEIKKIRSGAKLCLTSDKVAVIDYGKIHYFTQKGKYIRSVPAAGLVEKTVYFINENEILIAPQSLEPKSEKVKIEGWDLKSRQKRKIKEMTFSRPPSPSGKRLHIKGEAGLMPNPILSYHQGKLFFGVNHEYKIYAADLQGNLLFTIILEREKKKIDKQAKRDAFKNSPFKKKPQLFELFIKSIPSYPLCFYRIEEHNNLIYVFVPELNSSRAGSQRIDIFSGKGKFLYTGEMKFGNNRVSILPLSTLKISGGYLYVALENEAGDITLTKYTISIPGPEL